MAANTEVKSWPGLAESLYDVLTGRGAEITYEFDEMQVLVPSHAGPDATAAPWKLDGTLRIRTRDGAAGNGSNG